MGKLADEAITLASLLDHPVCDCMDLASAILRDCALVSCDARLIQRLVKSQHRDRVMPLADWRG